MCSSLCAAHCATSATAPALLAAFGVGSLASSTFEWGATILAVVLGLVAIGAGRRRHRSAWVSAILAAGIAGLVAGRLLEVADVHGGGTVSSVIAGLCLAAGHGAGILLDRSRALKR